jgi:thiosulfate/3-mercaptopyruvate sulfurtransferase
MATTQPDSAALLRHTALQAPLADAGWLAEHLYEPDVRVVEVDVKRSTYDDWHIDGAVLWNVYQDLKDDEYQLVGVAERERLFARSGITQDTTIVFYGYAPAMGMWLTKLHGHPDARILDCSRESWRAQGHSWSTATAEPARAEYHLGAEVETMRADRKAVARAIGHPDVSLVDVRSTPEYRGEYFWPSGSFEPGGRPGRIPTAVHLPIDDLYNENGSFRSPDDLRVIFSSVLLDGSRELITYCAIGGRASTAWFVLTYLLGREGVRVYDGSWAEWGRCSDTPVDVF